jgi:hypothetical protein
VTGGVAKVPANSRTREEYNGLFEPLLLVSADCGKTWTGPLAVVPAEHRAGWGGKEFDAAELRNGGVLCVFRRRDPKQNYREVRWQGLLKTSGDTWVPGDVGPAPFLPPTCWRRARGRFSTSRSRGRIGRRNRIQGLVSVPGNLPAWSAVVVVTAFCRTADHGRRCA